jgi:hypothetical protein
VNLTVVTDSSRHLLDLDRMTLTRLPGGGATAAGSSVEVATLRRDAEPLPIIEILELAVGAPMTVLLRVREDVVPTLRRTTTVREIRS